MADRKYHWAIQVTDPSQHRHAWKAYAGGHYAQACGRKHKSVLCDTADQFVAKVKVNPDWYCFDCAKAARLALAKESAPKPEPPKSTGPLRCSTKGCGSYAVNPEHHGRTYGVDLDLCDVCYWRKRAQPEPRPISEARETEILGYCPDFGWRRLSLIGQKWGLTGAVHIADYEPTHFLPLPPSPEVK